MLQLRTQERESGRYTGALKFCKKFYFAYDNLLYKQLKATTLILHVKKIRMLLAKMHVKYAFRNSRELYRNRKFLKWDFNYYTDAAIDAHKKPMLCSTNATTYK